MGEFVARNMFGRFKKINKRKNYRILLVAYIDIFLNLSMWCIVPNALYKSKSAPEDGRICRPKHVWPI